MIGEHTRSHGLYQVQLCIASSHVNVIANDKCCVQLQGDSHTNHSIEQRLKSVLIWI